MNPHHTVVDLPAVAVVLPADAHRILATFRRPRLVNATDGLAHGMVFGHDLLALISQLLFIPLDRFEKALQRAGRGMGLQRNGFSRFAVQIG